MPKLVIAAVVAVGAWLGATLVGRGGGVGDPADTTMGSGGMFDAIAKRYDMVNKVLSLGSDHAWRRTLISSLELEPGFKVLDLATGTADVAILLAQQPQRPTVTGVDPSNNMLDLGRAKISDQQLDESVQLFQGDAQALSGYDTDGFDRTTIAFGIRNIPDRGAALREMTRVTKPGGRVAILEFADPQEGVLAPVARVFIRHIVPRVGAMLSGGAWREYLHLQKSIAEFPTPTAFAESMSDAGLTVRSWKMIHPGGVYLYVADVPVPEAVPEAFPKLQAAAAEP